MYAVRKLTWGRALSLQLGAGVGVDFAVQTNFFKSGSSPFHDDSLQKVAEAFLPQREPSLPDVVIEINTSLRSRYPTTRDRQAI
jgi:hypothetical protein